MKGSMPESDLSFQQCQKLMIYLISIKEEKVFEKDQINFQQILRYQFDEVKLTTDTAVN